jgi:hypothetical protein
LPRSWPHFGLNPDRPVKEAMSDCLRVPRHLHDMLVDRTAAWLPSIQPGSGLKQESQAGRGEWHQGRDKETIP